MRPRGLVLFGVLRPFFSFLAKQHVSDAYLHIRENPEGCCTKFYYKHFTDLLIVIMYSNSPGELYKQDTKCRISPVIPGFQLSYKIETWVHLRLKRQYMNFYKCTAVCHGINPTVYTNHKNTVLLVGAKGMTCNNLLSMLQVKTKFRLKFFSLGWFWIYFVS